MSLILILLQLKEFISSKVRMCISLQREASELFSVKKLRGCVCVCVCSSQREFNKRRLEGKQFLFTESFLLKKTELKYVETHVSP